MTAFVLCLSVAAGAMALGGFLIGVSVGESRGRLLEACDAKAKRDVRLTFPGIDASYFPTFDAKQNARMWQSIQDRLAVDALVGPSTYEGGE